MSEPRYSHMTIGDHISEVCFPKHIHSFSLRLRLEIQLNYAEQGFTLQSMYCYRVVMQSLRACWWSTNSHHLLYTFRNINPICLWENMSQFPTQSSECGFVAVLRPSYHFRHLVLQPRTMKSLS